MGEKIAIIGGGMAGLTTAYLLNGKHDVKLFEKDDRLGGNAHTHASSDGLEFDIAAAIFGKKSYPNFVKLLKELKVDTCGPSGGGAGWRNLDTGEYNNFTWCLRGLIAQRFSQMYPWNALANAKTFLNIIRGWWMNNRGKFDGLTMEEAYAMLPEFPGATKYLHLFGMCLVSSMYYDDVMAAPAPFFFDKMAEHSDFFLNPVLNMFQPKHNTKSYVDALASHFEDKIVMKSKIKSVLRNDRGVTLKMDGGSEDEFGKVVFACNADQALRLIENPTDDEKRLLSPWTYQDGPIVVHKDHSSFPDKEYYNLFTWLYTDKDGKVNTSVNGHIRNLWAVPDDCKYISSQHPNFPIAEDLVDYKKVFRTPIFTKESVAAIERLPSLNGVMNSYFCGSHFGYGLHEDCVNSAAAVARMLGVEWG